MLICTYTLYPLTSMHCVRSVLMIKSHNGTNQTDFTLLYIIYMRERGTQSMAGRSYYIHTYPIYKTMICTSCMWVGRLYKFTLNST